MVKTLIGKDGHLFLINDKNKELQVHCNNLNLVIDKTLDRYNFNNFILIIFPDKSVLYKDMLPDKYLSKYRPALDIYKKKLKNKLLDTLDVLKDKTDVYYKTDTHINLNGNYIVYLKFIKKINKLFQFNLSARNIVLDKIDCELYSLGLGIGDLTWPANLGNQVLAYNMDTYYYSNSVMDFFNKYKIINTSSIRFLTYGLIDKTKLLAANNSIVDWNIISKYIIYNKNIKVNNTINSKKKQDINIL